MDAKSIQDYIGRLKHEKNVRVYTPLKYFTGLTTQKEIRSRFLDILRGSRSHTRDRRAYRRFATDIGKPTKESKYTRAFRERYGHQVASLKQKSAVTGVPLSILEKVFKKGQAAWRTGHRVGANAEQWAYARVHSFLMLGCTAFSSDFSLLREAVGAMSVHKLKQWLCQPILCPASTLRKAYYTKIGAKEFVDAWARHYCG